MCNREKESNKEKENLLGFDQVIVKCKSVSDLYTLSHILGYGNIEWPFDDKDLDKLLNHCIQHDYKYALVKGSEFLKAELITHDVQVSLFTKGIAYVGLQFLETLNK